MNFNRPTFVREGSSSLDTERSSTAWCMRNERREQAETFAVLHGCIHEELLRQTKKQNSQSSGISLERLRKEIHQLCHSALPTPPPVLPSDSVLMQQKDGSPSSFSFSLSKRMQDPAVDRARMNSFVSVESDLNRESVPLLRGIRWRVLLDSLSYDCRTWMKDVTAMRAEYASLRQKYIIDETMEHQRIQIECNPLTNAELFIQADQAKHIQKEILDDVLRTYADDEFFQQSSVQKQLCDILYVYSVLHPSLSYVQGMNELLAPLLYVISKDSEIVAKVISESKNSNDNVSPSAAATASPEMDRSKALNEILSDENLLVLLPFVTDSESIEADAFHLFSRLMFHISDWFIAPDSCQNNEKRQSLVDALQSIEESPVVTKCLEIERLLEEKDYDLARYLKELEIQPQLFMLRWLRILFSQVYSLNDLMIFWDAIFAIGPSFELVDHICVTLLSLARGSILGKDFGTVLSLLFHYPREKVPAYVVVSVALNSLRSRYSPLFVNDSAAYPGVLMLHSLFPDGFKPVKRLAQTSTKSQGRQQGPQSPVFRSQQSPKTSGTRFLGGRKKDEFRLSLGQSATARLGTDSPTGPSVTPVISTSKRRVSRAQTPEGFVRIHSTGSSEEVVLQSLSNQSSDPLSDQVSKSDIQKEDDSVALTDMTSSGEFGKSSSFVQLPSPIVAGSNIPLVASSSSTELSTTSSASSSVVTTPTINLASSPPPGMSSSSSAQDIAALKKQNESLRANNKALSERLSRLAISLNDILDMIPENTYETVRAIASDLETLSDAVKIGQLPMMPLAIPKPSK